MASPFPPKVLEQDFGSGTLRAGQQIQPRSAYERLSPFGLLVDCFASASSDSELKKASERQAAVFSRPALDSTSDKSPSFCHRAAWHTQGSGANQESALPQNPSRRTGGSGARSSPRTFRERGQPWAGRAGSRSLPAPPPARAAEQRRAARSPHRPPGAAAGGRAAGGAAAAGRGGARAPLAPPEERCQRGAGSFGSSPRAPQPAPAGAAPFPQLRGSCPLPGSRGAAVTSRCPAPPAPRAGGGGGGGHPSRPPTPPLSAARAGCGGQRRWVGRSVGRSVHPRRARGSFVYSSCS